MTRGIALNNPLNIRISPSLWKGKITPGRDGQFETFDTPENGIRAGAKLLLNYYERYGLNTVREIISRFAPVGENDTESYIADVAARIHADADAALDLKDCAQITALITAIIHHEQGSVPYSAAQLTTGITRALA